MIDFQTEDIEMPKLDFGKIKVWIRKVVSLHGFKTGDISYRFCSEEDILKSNIKFLGHNYFTDIITFDYSEGEVLKGDILISPDTVRYNASLIHLPYEEELLRVIIHGVLHLCGINDHGRGEREIMEKEEDEALKLYKEIDEI